MTVAARLTFRDSGGCLCIRHCEREHHKRQQNQRRRADEPTHNRRFDRFRILHRGPPIARPFAQAEPIITRWQHPAKPASPCVPTSRYCAAPRFRLVRPTRLSQVINLGMTAANEHAIVANIGSTELWRRWGRQWHVAVRLFLSKESMVVPTSTPRWWRVCSRKSNRASRLCLRAAKRSAQSYICKRQRRSEQ